MPQPPPNHTVNAWRALVRHAVMSEEVESGRRKPKLVPHMRRPVQIPVVSEASRAQYEYELTERAGSYMDAGLAQTEADARALEDFGCVEFWDYLQSTGGLCGPENDEVIEMEKAA